MISNIYLRLSGRLFMKKIVIICVCYYNVDEVIDYVNHVKKQSAIDKIDIVVTNNNDSDQEFHTLVNGINDQNIYLYNAGKNLGYIHGINYGLNRYLEGHVMPEWVIMSNTDIRYESEYFYEQLLSFYPNGYDCIIAPSIYSVYQNLYQNPLVINRYSKFRMFVLTNIFKYMIIERCFNIANIIRKKFEKSKKTLIENQEIYSGHGACLIINRRYFLNGGNLNYGGFLFGEELYIAEMVKLIGGKTYFDNRLRIKHYEHSTIKKVKRRTINQHYFLSMKYIFRKFY